MNSSIWIAFKGMLRKELCVGFRSRTRWVVMFMFAVTMLACVSLAVGGMGLPVSVQAALLWILIFFAALTGTGQTFTDEAQQGTFLLLRSYGQAQTVLFGKMVFMFLELLLLTLVIVPLACVFLNIDIAQPLPLVAVLLLGLAGIAGAGTLVAFLTLSAKVRNGLFFILMLPLLLPVFLTAIAVTTAALEGRFAAVSWLFGLALYDALLIAGSSVLFDYVWYEA